MTEVQAYLAGLVDELRDELGADLTAVIVHGSLAMGTFRPPKSDIDLLVVVTALSESGARRLYELFERRHTARPYAGGLEVSVIRAADAARPVHPLPYLVHFSETTTGFFPWPDGALPADEDLIAHLMVAKHRGRSSYGPEPAYVIGELSWHDYLASVRSDIDWILSDENLLTTPYYGVLNLCRWAMMTASASPIVPGKDEAGEWALAHLPEAMRPVVVQALAAYRSPEWPASAHERRRVGGPWDRDQLLAFRDHARHHSDRGDA